MKTINSSNSLIYWEQNENLSGISAARGYLKEDYLSFFQQIKKCINKGGRQEFIKSWHSVLNKYCSSSPKSIVYAKVNVLSKDKNSARRAENVMKVVNKFRGNVGEIMAEAILVKFPTEFDIIGDTYTPVDPTHEEYVDAEALSVVDQLPVGIQVKDYTMQGKELYNPVRRKTFDKAQVMTIRWVQCQRRIPEDKIIQYLSRPRQIIFSFTEVNKDDYQLIDQTSGAVQFKGPKDIKKLKLEQKSYIFDEIIDAISRV